MVAHAQSAGGASGGGTGGAASPSAGSAGTGTSGVSGVPSGPTNSGGLNNSGNDRSGGRQLVQAGCAAAGHQQRRDGQFIRTGRRRHHGFGEVEDQ